MLKAIEIENFKAVGDRVCIELRPITLLFGPNSAGKSTIIQALHYARELLVHGNADVHHPELGGEFIDLGGFRKFVHNRDLEREVALRLEFEPRRNEPLVQLGELVVAGDKTGGIARALACANETRKLAVELGVAWSHDLERPMVTRYDVHWGGEFLLSLATPRDRYDVTLSSVNWMHSIFRAAMGAAMEPEGELSAGEAASQIEQVHPLGALFGHLARKQLEQFDAQAPRPLSSVVQSAGRNIGFALTLSTSAERVTVHNTPRLPIPGHGFTIDIEDSRVASGWSRLLTHMVLAHYQQARALLETESQFIHLGPIRATVPRDYERPPVAGLTRSTRLSRWYSGLTAWDDVLTPDRLAPWDDQMYTTISDWLFREDRLATGYKLDVQRYHEVLVDHPAWRDLLAPDESDEPAARGSRAWNRQVEALFDYLTSAPLRYRVALRKVESDGTELEVSPCDVGVGISQVLPVVVATFSCYGTIAIEQPELHIHPALQARLGDLFIENSKFMGAHLLVETHSEHLMLRLLRRIRETTDGTLKNDDLSLTPADVRVIYVEPSDDGVKVSRLRIADDGDFDDQWPQGFFTERADELF